MNDSEKFQINIIMKNFRKLKEDYLELSADRKFLEEEVEKLRKRLAEKEQQRCRLILMLKNRVTENQARVESLQRQNSHLETTVHDQSELIEEHANTIEKLKKEIETLKINNDDNNNTGKKNNPGHIIRRGIIQIENQTNINDKFNKSSHPSFDDDAQDLKKIKRNPKCRKNGKSQFRWSGLDILVNGVGNGVKTEADKSMKPVRKRKLYCPDDDIVDLDSEIED